MGKNKQKDPNFVKQKERRYNLCGGGKLPTVGTSGAGCVQQLTFDTCCITLQALDVPAVIHAGSSPGYLAELAAAQQFVEKHGKHPATGDLARKHDIKRLKMFYDHDEQQYYCPVLHKRFNNSTAIVAVLPPGESAGTVYSYEAVKEMNLKQKDLHDLLSGEPFCREHILTVQSGSSPRPSITKLYCVAHGLKRPSLTSLPSGTQDSGETQRFLDAAHDDAPSSQAKPMYKSTPGAQQSIRYQKGASTFVSAPTHVSDAETEHKRTPAAGADEAASTINPVDARAAAFTSTNVAAQQSMMQHDTRRQRLPKSDGYVRLHIASHGCLNLEVKCQEAPIAAERFLLYARQSRLENLPLQRLMPNYVLEFQRLQRILYAQERPHSLKHKRGILSTSADRPDAFFVVLQWQEHLDQPQRKCCPFARVVGGFEVLSALEEVGATAGDNTFAPAHPISIANAEVFHNPFEEMEKHERNESEKRKEQSKRGRWFSQPAGAVDHTSDAPPGRKYMKAGQ